MKRRRFTEEQIAYALRQSESEKRPREIGSLTGELLAIEEA
jgi:hypothetical protein